jgi:hypothetical protein
MSNHFSADNLKLPGDGDEHTRRVARGAAIVALPALGVGIDRVRDRLVPGRRGPPGTVPSDPPRPARERATRAIPGAISSIPAISEAGLPGMGHSGQSRATARPSVLPE